MTLSNDVRIGWFLAVRQIRRASIWTTSLIILVMVLTFLNLVVVSGVLVGLIQGAVEAVRDKYTSDVIVSSLTDKEYIEDSINLIALIDSLPQVESFTPRYRQGGILEANYQTRKDTEKANTASAQIVGIDSAMEHDVTRIKDDVIEGSFLTPDDYDKVVLGHYLLKQYMPIETPSFATLENVSVGSKIRLNLGGAMREVTVKGIIKTKVDEVSMSAYMVGTQLRGLIGRSDGNVDEIAIKVRPGVDPASVRDAIVLRGGDAHARVQTYEDGQPKFLKDMINTFNLLGAAFSSIGLVVASVTIFIVVFINAITRRKFIGILKGIGISARAIEVSYVMQSIWYALCGSAIGLVLVYGVLVPYFASNPIDFPFSDGILVAPMGETIFRIMLLIVATLIAGFIPAWMIVRKNTLDSILGRN